MKRVIQLYLQYLCNLSLYTRPPAVSTSLYRTFTHTPNLPHAIIPSKTYLITILYTVVWQSNSLRQVVQSPSLTLILDVVTEALSRPRSGPVL